MLCILLAKLSVWAHINHDYGYTDGNGMMNEPTVPEVPNNSTNNTERPTTPLQLR